MTVVSLMCCKNGSLFSCSAEGHSGFAPKGFDIVCAAVSVLMRTTLQVLVDSYGEIIKSEITTRGKLAFRVDGVAGQNCDRLIYAADFLRTGLKSLEKEYPKYISLREQIRD